jgi:diguanylate cyclase (GGDEF)-like protein
MDDTSVIEQRLDHIEPRELLENPLVIESLVSENLGFCSAAALCASLMCSIGLAGTFSPFSSGQVLPQINATMAYLTLGLVNIVFMQLFRKASKLFQLHKMKAETCRGIIVTFQCADMILASVTFFTTQMGSSFFFEYILVTVIAFLMPLNRPSNAICYALVNGLSAVFVMTVVLSDSPRSAIAWQDWVDLAILLLICLAVSWLRWRSFLRYQALRISLLKREDDALQKARRDELTQLLNRTALRDDFPSLCSGRANVALMDIDSFKRINDVTGHQQGDRVLSLVGESIRSMFDHAGDHCYRYGGDEFLIITVGEGRAEFVKRLEVLQSLCSERGGADRANLSIGYVSASPHSGEQLRDCIKRADHWMYVAKRSDKTEVRGEELLPFHKLRIA